jgi:hypothetical protein
VTDRVSLALAWLLESFDVSVAVCRGDLFDCLPGVIRRAPLHENDLGTGAHLGRPFDNRLDIAGFVPRRHDNRDSGFRLTGCGRWASDQKVGQTEVIDRPQLHEKLVGKTAGERNRDRYQDLLPAAEGLVPTEFQDVADVVGGEPVLLQNRPRDVDGLGHDER